MSKQNYHFIFVVDDKEYLYTTAPELRLAIESNTVYLSREIKFFLDNKYHKEISNFYNKKFNIIV